MSHDSPCRATRVHMGLTQQCTLGLGHSRPHTYPPIGEAEYAALLQRVEALRDERDNLVRSRIDRAACCAQVEEERDAALAAQKRAEEERDEARKLAAEGRKAGRAEAAAILMAQEAESFPSANGDDALVESYAIGDTGDYGTSWIPEKVLDLFDAGDSEMTSILDRLEGGYWEAVVRKDDADDARRRAESALAALRAEQDEVWRALGGRAPGDGPDDMWRQMMTDPGVRIATLRELVADLRAAPPNALRAKVEEIAEHLARAAEEYDAKSQRETKNEDERRTALAQYVSATWLRDVVKSLRAALAPAPPAALRTPETEPKEGGR